MTSAQLPTWFKETSIEESLIGLQQFYDAMQQSCSKERGAEFREHRETIANENKATYMDGDKELTRLNNQISIGLKIDNEFSELEDILTQDRITNKNLNEIKNRIFSKISSISDTSSELFSERSNLSHLRFEIEMNKSYYLDIDTFKLKANFFDQITTPNEFYKYTDNYLKMVEKIRDSYIFFSNRRSYFDAKEQLEFHDHLIRRIQNSISNIFMSYYKVYFEQLTMALTVPVKVIRRSETFFSASHLDTGFKNREMIIPYLKNTSLLQRTYRSGLLENIFEGRLEESESCIKSVLLKIVLGLELHSELSNKLNDTFAFFFNEAIFESYHKKLWQFYAQSYLKWTGKLYESLVASESGFSLMISYCLTDILTAISNFEYVLGSLFLKSETFDNLIWAYIKGLVDTFKQKLKSVDEFDNVLSLFKSVLVNYRIDDICLFADNPLDIVKVEDNLLRIHLYKNLLSFASNSSDFVPIVNFNCQRFILLICEILLFQVEYMLNKILQQHFRSTNFQPEVSTFDAKEKVSLVDEFCKSTKIFEYITEAITSLNFGYDNLKEYIVKFALLVYQRVLNSAVLVKDDIFRFAFKIKNLAAVHRRLNSNISVESLYNFETSFIPESNVVGKIEKEFSKHSMETIHIFCSTVISIVINNEILRLSNYLILEGQRMTFRPAEFLKLIERLLNDIKLKFSLSLDGYARDITSKLFLTNFMRFFIQRLEANCPQSDREEIKRKVRETFESILNIEISSDLTD
jgi:hypothetical protein